MPRTKKAGDVVHEKRKKKRTSKAKRKSILDEESDYAPSDEDLPLDDLKDALRKRAAKKPKRDPSDSTEPADDGDEYVPPRVATPGAIEDEKNVPTAEEVKADLPGMVSPPPSPVEPVSDPAPAPVEEAPAPMEEEPEDNTDDIPAHVSAPEKKEEKAEPVVDPNPVYAASPEWFARHSVKNGQLVWHAYKNEGSNNVYGRLCHRNNLDVAASFLSPAGAAHWPEVYPKGNYITPAEALMSPEKVRFKKSVLKEATFNLDIQMLAWEADLSDDNVYDRTQMAFKKWLEDDILPSFCEFAWRNPLGLFNEVHTVFVKEKVLPIIRSKVELYGKARVVVDEFKAKEAEGVLSKEELDAIRPKMSKFAIVEEEVPTEDEIRFAATGVCPQALKEEFKDQFIRDMVMSPIRTRRKQVKDESGTRKVAVPCSEFVHFTTKVTKRVTKKMRKYLNKRGLDVFPTPFMEKAYNDHDLFFTDIPMRDGTSGAIVPWADRKIAHNDVVFTRFQLEVCSWNSMGGNCFPKAVLESVVFWKPSPSRFSGEDDGGVGEVDFSKFRGNSQFEHTSNNCDGLAGIKLPAKLDAAAAVAAAKKTSNK